MDIRDEYERLKTFAVSKEKWQEINELWMIASNYEKRGNEWYKKRQSAGQNVTSFALDLKTYAYMVGLRGQDHFKARLDLIEKLSHAESVNFDSVDSRVIEGRMAYVEGWPYPLITFVGMWIFEDPEMLDAVEEKVLEFELGLPISKLSLPFLR